MNEKINYEKQLQEFYGNHKMKKYYTTKEIIEKIGISLRTLRYRIKELKEKYKNVPALLYKDKNTWKIHRQLLEEFTPKIRRTKTSFNMNWNTFITWVMLNDYDLKYHHQLALEIKESFPFGHFDYVIEKTKRGINHVHMVTDLPAELLKEPVDEIINNYIPKTEYRLEVEKVKSKALTRNYMNK